MLKSISRKIYMELPPPGDGDIVADKDRIVHALKNDFGYVVISLNAFRRPYLLLRNSNWKLTVSMVMKGHEREVVQIEPAGCRLVLKKLRFA